MLHYKEVTNTPDHQKNQPPKIAHFIWYSMIWPDQLTSTFVFEGCMSEKSWDAALQKTF